MPAAAVIPAPLAYIKVVAVKKLVVGSVSHAVGSPPAGATGMPRDVLSVAVVTHGALRLRPKRADVCQAADSILPRCSSLSVEVGRHVYFEQIRVLKAG